MAFFTMVNIILSCTILLNIFAPVHNENRGEKMVDYAPLWKTMKEKNISQYHLIKKCDIDNKTIYNLKRNKSITMATLEKLCDALDCTPNDIVSFHKEQKNDSD